MRLQFEQTALGTYGNKPWQALWRKNSPMGNMNIYSTDSIRIFQRAVLSIGRNFLGQLPQFWGYTLSTVTHSINYPESAHSSNER